MSSPMSPPEPHNDVRIPINLNWQLESTARKFPRKEAIVADTGMRLTYADLLGLSRRAARVFRDAGVGPGDRVGVMTFNTPAFLIAAFGIWRAGATLVPINHKLTSAEVGYLCDHSGLRVGVVDESLAPICEGAGHDIQWLTTTDGGHGTFDRLVHAATEWDGVQVDEDDAAEILYTSGTTSRPKGCVHSHRALTTVAAYTTSGMAFTRDDRFLIAMPIWHASPLNNWMLSMIYMGGTVVLAKEYHPIAFLELIQREKVTAFFGSPTAYLAPLQIAASTGIDFAAFDLSSVRLWAYGGAPIGADAITTLMSAYRSENFVQVYGMSETGPVGAALYPEEQIAKAGSIGAAGMPGVDLRVVTESGEDAAAGEVGELWMRTDTRMRGYLGDEEATRAVFAGDWYRTGDLARVDGDGYFFIVDRLKDVIIIGGENVYSPEVEDALRSHPGITDAAVIGRPHEHWGETVVAAVVTLPEVRLDIEDVRDYLADRLARYKLPRELVIRDELPRNPSGKVMKHILRSELAEPVS